MAGSTIAFERLVVAHAPSIYRTARAIVGEASAADVTQDTFIAAWKGLPRLEDPDRFGAWLYRLTVNRCHSLRRRAYWRREIPLANTAVDGVLGVDFRPAVEQRVLVASSFRRLKERHRAVIALHYAAGLTLSEIAEVLDVPTGTVKSRLNVALAELRRMLHD